MCTTSDKDFSFNIAQSIFVLYQNWNTYKNDFVNLNAKSGNKKMQQKISTYVSNQEPERVWRREYCRLENFLKHGVELSLVYL